VAAVSLLSPTVSFAADAPPAVDGVAHVASAADFATTVSQARAAIEGRGLTLMATVDHAANAQKAGLELRPTTLLIFGNPKVGTQLMAASQTAGLDLPMKLLVWQDAEGKVWVGTNDPGWITGRHGIEGKEGLANKVRGVLAEIAAEATK